MYDRKGEIAPSLTMLNMISIRLVRLARLFWMTITMTAASGMTRSSEKTLVSFWSLLEPLTLTETSLNWQTFPGWRGFSNQNFNLEIFCKSSWIVLLYYNTTLLKWAKCTFQLIWASFSLHWSGVLFLVVLVLVVVRGNLCSIYFEFKSQHQMDRCSQLFMTCRFKRPKINMKQSGVVKKNFSLY